MTCWSWKTCSWSAEARCLWQNSAANCHPASILSRGARADGCRGERLSRESLDLSKSMLALQEEDASAAEKPLPGRATGNGDYVRQHPPWGRRSRGWWGRVVWRLTRPGPAKPLRCQRTMRALRATGIVVRVGAPCRLPRRQVWAPEVPVLLCRPGDPNAQGDIGAVRGDALGTPAGEPHLLEQPPDPMTRQSHVGMVRLTRNRPPLWGG